MFDFTPYIGKPYSFRDYHCFDHVCAVRKDAGIKTPEFRPSTLDGAYDLITEQVDCGEHGLTLVDKPQNFDVVICHKMRKGKPIYHCGIWYNGFINHCSLAAKQVIHEPFREFKKSYEGVTFWR